MIAKKDGGGEAYYIGFILEVKSEPPKLKVLFDETDDPVDFQLSTLRIFDDDGVCSEDGKFSHRQVKPFGPQLAHICIMLCSMMRIRVLYCHRLLHSGWNVSPPQVTPPWMGC